MNSDDGSGPFIARVLGPQGSTLHENPGTGTLNMETDGFQLEGIELIACSGGSSSYPKARSRGGDTELLCPSVLVGRSGTVLLRV